MMQHADEGASGEAKEVTFVIRPWDRQMARRVELAIHHRYIMSNKLEAGMKEPTLAEYLRFLINKDLTELKAQSQERMYKSKAKGG